MAQRSPEQLIEELRGVLAFPVTPFHADGSLNLAALRTHVGSLVGTGVAAVFACAGTGEFFSLALEEYSEAVRAVVDEVDGRLPVFAGVGYSTVLAVEFARRAERAGADGILILPPYLVQAEQEGLCRHYRAVAEAVPLGVVLYHRDNALFAPATVCRLAALPNLVGFKDGHGNLELFQRIQLVVGSRLAWMNGMPTAEMTFPSYYAAGAAAYSSAISNFFPLLTLRFFRAVVEGDRQTVDAILRNVVEPICRVRDRRKGYAVSYVKAALNLLGRPDAAGAGPVRPPLTDLSPADLEDLRRLLSEIAGAYPEETA
jgi:5-dehydro-4-deoxyglucarate dehydratase